MKKLPLFAVTALLGAGLAFAQAPAASTAKPETTTKVKKHHKKKVKKSKTTSANTATPSNAK
jgi:hypothetical protein